MFKVTFAKTLCMGFTMSVAWLALGSCSDGAPDERSAHDVQELGEAAEGSTTWSVLLSQGTVLKRLKDKPYATDSRAYGAQDLCFLPIELKEIPLEHMVRIGDTRDSHSKIGAQTGFKIPALFTRERGRRIGSDATEQQSREGEEEVEERGGQPESSASSTQPQSNSSGTTVAGRLMRGRTETPVDSSAAAIEESGDDSWFAGFDENVRANELYRSLKARGITFANERSECPFGFGWVYEGHVSGAVKEPGMVQPFDYTPIRSCLSAQPFHLAFAAGRDGGSRSHAACDVHGNVGDSVVAIADGQILNVYDFYLGTCAVEVLHQGNGWKFVARYGELRCGARAGISAGRSVTKGARIGTVGNLIGISDSMLHFELFTGERSGDLTTLSGGSAAEYFAVEGANPGRFYRRRDLMNPTQLIRSWRQQ